MLAQGLWEEKSVYDSLNKLIAAQTRGIYTPIILYCDADITCILLDSVLLYTSIRDVAVFYMSIFVNCIYMYTV